MTTKEQIEGKIGVLETKEKLEECKYQVLLNRDVRKEKTTHSRQQLDSRIVCPTAKDRLNCETHNEEVEHSANKRLCVEKALLSESDLESINDAVNYCLDIHVTFSLVLHSNACCCSYLLLSLQDTSEDDECSSSSDGEEEIVTLKDHVELNPFDDSQDIEYWSLESGSVRDILSRETRLAMERMSASGKADKNALNVIRLGLSSIIDLSSEFDDGMFTWFGKDWWMLKEKALKRVDITPKRFESIVKDDVTKIEELCSSFQYWEARNFVLERLKDQSNEILCQQVMRCYYVILDMFLADPHVFVEKDGRRPNLSEMDFVINIIGPIIEIIFSDTHFLQLKWGNTVFKAASACRKIDLKIVGRNSNMEFSHSEFARVATPAKLMKDRSKCLRTNQCILNSCISSFSHEVIGDSFVLGLQVAGLYGQIIGIDILGDGLYFGFDGPTFRFPSQLSDIAILQQTLEVLYLWKNNIISKTKMLSSLDGTADPFQEIFHKAAKKDV